MGKNSIPYFVCWQNVSALLSIQTKPLKSISVDLSGPQHRMGGWQVNCGAQQKDFHKSLFLKMKWGGEGNAHWLPWTLRWKRNCLQCRRPGLNPWVRKIPWRRKWLPTPVFLPGEFYGQRSLVVYSPWGHKESDMTERLTLTHRTRILFIDDLIVAPTVKMVPCQKLHVRDLIMSPQLYKISIC